MKLSFIDLITHEKKKKKTHIGQKMLLLLFLLTWSIRLANMQAFSIYNYRYIYLSYNQTTRM
jgi:hypothetical protein